MICYMRLCTCQVVAQIAMKTHITGIHLTATLVAVLFWFVSGIVPVYASTILQPDDFPIVGVLHAGNRPEALAVDTQTHMLYIAYESPGQVVGFDPISGQVQWRDRLGDSTTDVQVDSTTHRVFATVLANRSTNLFVLDGASGKTLTMLPVPASDNSIALDSHRHQVYITGERSIAIFTFIAGWQTGIPSVQTSQLNIGTSLSAIAVNSRLGRVYIADSTTNMLTVVDEESQHVLANIPVAELPLPPLRVDEASGHVFVVCSDGQELDVIDGIENRVIGRAVAAPYPEGVAINTATGRIYVADEGNKEGNRGDRGSGTTLTIIDGQDFSAIGTFKIGAAPDGVEADPELHRVYISLEDANAVVEMVDSVNLPLKPEVDYHQATVARQTILVLQQATIVTILAMVLTLVVATLGALLPHWRARGNPRTRPDGELSDSGGRSPPP